MPHVAVNIVGPALLELGNETWRADALCLEHPELEWFPTTGEPIDPARDVCVRCLVQAECLAFALGSPETLAHGIWAGTSPQERERYDRRSRRNSHAHSHEAASTAGIVDANASMASHRTCINSTVGAHRSSIIASASGPSIIIVIANHRARSQSCVFSAGASWFR